MSSQLPRIKVNYTAYLVGDWELIVEKHLFAMKCSGLYKDCTEFNVFAYPEDNRLTDLVDKYGLSGKTNIVFCKENKFEFPAIIDLVENPMDMNLYFHTKGLTLKLKGNRPVSYVSALAWNDYMTYFCVYCYDICQQVLQSGFSAVGVEFGKQDKPGTWHHYSGNFWWASRQHLDRIRSGEYWNEFKSSNDRYACETVISTAPGKFVELYNTGTNTHNTGYLYHRPILTYGFDKNHVKIYDVTVG